MQFREVTVRYSGRMYSKYGTTYFKYQTLDTTTTTITFTIILITITILLLLVLLLLLSLFILQLLLLPLSLRVSLLLILLQYYYYYYYFITTTITTTMILLAYCNATTPRTTRRCIQHVIPKWVRTTICSRHGTHNTVCTTRYRMQIYYVALQHQSLAVLFLSP